MAFLPYTSRCRLPRPVLPEAKGFTFSVHDPSFFIAFDLAKTDQPVRLGEGAPQGCALKIGAPDRNPGDVSALGELLTAIHGFRRQRRQDGIGRMQRPMTS